MYPKIIDEAMESYEIGSALPTKLKVKFLKVFGKKNFGEKL